MAPNAKISVSVNQTFSNYRFSVSLNSSIHPTTRQLLVSGIIIFQRCAYLEDGTVMDDPTAGSSSSFSIADLTEFIIQNPSFASAIGTAWTDLAVVADALNTAATALSPSFSGV